MARCRDIIIERGRWICSVLLMSALAASVLGVAGADGHGFEWSAVHPKRARVIVVHWHGPATFHSSAPATFASHASSKGSSHQTGAASSRPQSGYGSSVTATPDDATQQGGSGSTNAQPPAQAALHLPAGRPRSAPGSVHAGQSSARLRSSLAHHQSGRVLHPRFLAASDNTGASDSAALGAWTGASVEVATEPAGCPDAASTTPEGGAAPGAGQTTSAPGDASTTGPGDSSQTATAQAPGCGTGQAGGTQGNDGQSNTAPSTGAADQSGQGDTGSSQTGQGAGDQGQGTGNPAQGSGDQGQGTGNPAQGSGDQGQGTGNPAQGAGNPAQGNGNQAQGSGNPAQGNGNQAQGNGDQGQGAGGGTCPADSTGAGAADAGQGGGGDASGVATPAVGASSANGTSDQTTSDTGCGPDTGSTPGGPLTSRSPGTGDTGSQDDGSTVGGPLTAVSPGQSGSSPTPSPVTIPPITSSPAPSTNPVVPSTNPVTPITNPVTPVSPAPRTRTPVTSTLPGDFSSIPRLISAFGNVTGGGLTTPAAGGTGLGAASGLGAGSGLGTGTGLGALTPATSQIAARGGAKGSHRAKRAHSGGSSTQAPPLINVPGAQALVHFVDRIPEWVWIAIAALAALAVVGFGAAFRSRRLVRRQAGAIAAASAAALTDPLTGVVNRRGFAEEVERELARARRYERPFVLAYVDVRGLKTVNDTEGHLAGDELLKSVAGLLRDSARADDVVGRLGGDELGLLLVEQSAEGADVVTQRVQSLLPERRAELGLASDWGLTIGTAAYPEDGQTFDELLATADHRLYEQRGIDIRRA
jgi:diguanylate cyclase (GGDEF)-like protein